MATCKSWSEEKDVQYTQKVYQLLQMDFRSLEITRFPYFMTYFYQHCGWITGHNPLQTANRETMCSNNLALIATHTNPQQRW